MTKENYYRDLAYDYEGQSLLLKCKASIHLEYDVDEWFWDVILQRHHPAKYNYIYYSRHAGGEMTSGCTQCLQFKDYLSDRFFICIDSDFRYLFQEVGIDAWNFICQTYTYSWENHYCFAEGLQERLMLLDRQAAQSFNFEVFLQVYSDVVYEPLLLFLYMKKNGIEGFSSRKFTQALSLQYRTGDLKNNGMPVIERLKKAFAFVTELKSHINFDIEQIKDFYEDLGLVKENAYLHIRGHNLYNLIRGIGIHLNPDFEYEVLLKELPASERYWEILRVVRDLNEILDKEPSPRN